MAKNPYVKIWTLHGASFFPFFIMDKVLTKDIKEIIGCKLTKMYTVIYDDDISNQIVIEDEWVKLCKKATKK